MDAQMAKLGKAGALKIQAKAQARRDLHGKPFPDVVMGLLYPSEELAACRLSTLLVPSPREDGLFGAISAVDLWRIAEHLGRDGHHIYLSRRLRELSLHQRRVLVKTVLEITRNTAA